MGERCEAAPGWVDAYSRSVCLACQRFFRAKRGTHDTDQRNPPPLGRVGDPDDIIASVLVENSAVKPETYQPMPSYRMCTADGVLQLTPELLTGLVKALERVVEGDNATVNP